MTIQPFGVQLRQWRQRRRLSQLELALQAEISARHLSFIETGRARPSRDMVLHLSEGLEVPLRQRNQLLLAAGFAPLFEERSLDDPEAAAVRSAIDIVLEGHKPFPAFVLDRHWNIVASNQALPMIYEGVAPELLQRPINVVRLTLHPAGLASRIENLAQWREHVLLRLRRQLELTGDETIADLLREAQAWPAPDPETPGGSPQVVIPLILRTSAGSLSFFSTTMVFGTPADVTVEELMVESFFPADAETGAIVCRLPTGA